MKYKNDVINDNVQFRGNVSLKHKERHYDRKISEVIKKLDISKNLEACFQDEHGEQWRFILV